MIESKIIFEGKRSKLGVLVFHNKEPLSPKESQKLINHSPTGFEWGYSGSGPAQLALSILLSHTKDKEYSMSNYQKFKRDFISKIRSPEWKISEKEMDSWIQNNK